MPGPQWDQNNANTPYSNPGPQNSQSSWTPPSSRQNPSDPWQTAVPTGDERTWAMLAHLSAPIAAIVSAGWLTFVGPLIIWFLQKDRSRFVRQASAGAFNFSFTMWVVSLIGWILTVTLIGAVIGIPMIIIGALGSIILGCIGAFKTYYGELYIYPWQLRILS